MKVLVQWARSEPTDWVEIDSSEWSTLAKKSEPTNLSSINNALGWVQAINIQGINFNGFDHYALEEITDGIKVYIWNDDPDDWVDDFHGYIWTILEPAYDDNVKQINTRQTVEVYAEKQERLDRYLYVPNCTGRKPWFRFRSPRASNIKHGVWVENTLNEKHLTRQASRGWKEWIN